MEIDYQHNQGQEFTELCHYQAAQTYSLEPDYASDRLLHPGSRSPKNATSPPARTQESLINHLAFYRAIAENLPNGGAIAFDQHLRYQSATGSGLAQWGLCAQTLLGKTLWEIFPPEILLHLEPACQTALNQVTQEQMLTWGDRIYQVRVLPFPGDASDTSGVLMIWQDITPCKHLEQQLNRSEERWQLIVNSNRDGIWDWNLKTGEVFFSPRWKAMLGYTNPEIAPQIEEWFQRLHPDDRTLVLNRLQDHFDRKTPVYRSEHRLLCKNGHYKWVLDQGQADWDENGDLIRMIGSQTDIHQHKKIETELRKTQDFLQTIIDHLPVALFVKDGRPETFGQIILWNQTSETLLGMTAEQVLGKKVTDLFTQTQAELFQSQDIQVFNQREPMNISEELIVTHTSEKRFLHTMKIPVYDDFDCPLYLVCFSEDITERKQAKERLELFIKASKDGFWDWDLINNEIYFSPRWKEMLGYADTELSNQLSSWEAVIYEEDKITASEMIADYNQGRIPEFLATQRFHHKNGSTAYILSRAIHVKDDQGQPVRMVGAHTDITDLKQVQADLQHSQALLAGILNSSLDGVMAFKSVRNELGEIVDFQWLVINSAAESIINRKAEDLIDKYLLQEMPGNRTEGLFDAYVQVVETGVPLNREFYYRYEQIQTWFQVVAVKFNDGFTVTFRDISDRKLAEINLRRQALTFENIYDGAIITDLKGCIVDWNPAAERIFGYAKSEVLGQSVGILYQDPNLVLQILDALARQERWFGEIHCLHQTGTQRICEATIVPLRDNHDRIIATISVHRDITDAKLREIERQRAEAELSQQKEILQSIFDHIPIMIAFYDTQGRIQLMNRELEKTMGWSLAEAQQIDLMTYCYPDPIYRQEILEFMLNSDGKWKDMQTRIRNNQVLETSWANVRLSDGTTVGIGQDITERKQAEAQLRQQAERERLLGVIQTRIRQSLDLEEILDTAVIEVLQLLKCDRVLIVRFLSDQTCQIISEAVDSRHPQLLGTIFTNPCQASESCTNCQYLHHPVINPSPEAIAQCLEKLISELQHKTRLIVPIVQKETNWGLLIADQDPQTRQWQPWEIELLQQLALQVGIATQQSELYQQLQIANQELRRLATVDGLTQVANRRYFDEYLHQEWRRLLREQSPLSLILCDLDFFKVYNDTYGHQAGDDCLQQVAAVMRRILKRPADLVARYGGEEFAIILPHTPGQGAFALAETLRQGIQSLKIPHRGSAVSEFVTLSIGIASQTPQLDSSVETLIAEADRALYQAKASGRDRAILAAPNFQIPN